MYLSASLDVEGHLLRGVVRTPEGDGPFPTLIFMHGFTVDKVGPARLYELFAKQCQKEGFAVIRFDFYGCGESDGDFNEMTLGSEMKETEVIYHWAEQQPYVDASRIFLGGHSMGGLLSTLMAPVLQPRGIVAWSPALLMFYEAARRARTMKGKTEKGYDINGLELSDSYLSEICNMDFMEMVKGYHGPVLIVHGAQDEEMPAACDFRYRHIYGDQLQIHLVENANHLFTALPWKQEAYDISLEFLKKEAGLRREEPDEV